VTGVPAHVHVGDDAVDISFSGIDRLLTFAPGGVHLCLADIVVAKVRPVAGLRGRLAWRVGGGYFPNRLATGWFTVKGEKGKRELWCVYRGHEVLAIDTRLKRPSRVVLQLPDRHDIAWYIGERLPR
jgi:hypothetical protein